MQAQRKKKPSAPRSCNDSAADIVRM